MKPRDGHRVFPKTRDGHRVFAAFLLALLPAVLTGAGREEVLGLGSKLGGSETEENRTVRERLRGLLAAAAVEAAGDGERAVAARGLLEEVCAHPKRRFAMEGALALLDLPAGKGLGTFFRAYPRADAAVRRQALELVLARAGRDAVPEPVLLDCLATEAEPEAASLLVRLAAERETLGAARAVLRAAPEPPAEETESAGRAAGLEQAVIGALSALAGPPEKPLLRGWLGGPAFGEVRGKPGAERALALTAAAAGIAEAVPALLDLLRSSRDEAVLLAALGSLETLTGSYGARRPEIAGALRSFLEAGSAAPSTRRLRRAAAFLESLQPGAASDLLAGMAVLPGWEARRAAAEALGALARSEAAYRALRPLLADPNREVRRAAFASLRSFRRPEAVSQAIALLGSAGPGRAEAQNYLEWAARRSLGSDPRVWARWWKESEGRFEFPR